MSQIKLKITTPDRVVFEDQVDQITIPTHDGEITILPSHVPLISTIRPGIMEAKKNGDEIDMAVSGGFLELHDNELTILADTAERAEEIDLEEAEAARKRAEQMKMEHTKSLDDSQYAAVASMLETQIARVKLAKKMRTKTGFKITGDGMNG